MIVRRMGGMTEMIPTPREKREAVVRDHVLELLENMHERIGRLERGFFIAESEAKEFDRLIERIRREEREARAIHPAAAVSVKTNGGEGG